MGHVEGRGTAKRRKTGIRRWETTETTTGVFHRRLTFARGVWRRSRSIFSTSIEGEDIAACGSESDIGSDTC